ncbi:MFS transporter [Gemmiger formicilis]|uniref:MFS transporter n=1 Tax=Gemmiger formicilis TaxID=745368 RepID=UPI00195AC22D|nr:MFS transporter [Gemmiger formicilis]MBM6899662.1 MFS transporter [Gemmiger formicilis]
MTITPNYQKTLHACYLGYVTQAICANFAPLLFLTFQKSYHISMGELALIPTVFFLTQLMIDLVAANFVDRIGYRTCLVAAHGMAAVGLVLLAFLPDLLPVPFLGILISVMVYAVSSGLVEVVVSPIVEACPFENKASRMSLLHSFYCWGMMAVVLGSTVFFALFGLENWRILTLLWALIPLWNVFNFIACPIERLVESGEGMGGGSLLRLPLFWFLVLLMVCSGAAENAMTQWASAFAEAAIGVPKTLGDLAGPCLFAALMGTSRVLCAKMSHKMDLGKIMLACGMLCIGCYLVASLSVYPVAGLAGCALCGFSVGIMWPGTLSLSSRACPKGGTAMFAFLALAGDLGGTVGPMSVGVVSEAVGGDLKKGFLVAAVFPIALVLGLVALQKRQK